MKDRTRRTNSKHCSRRFRFGTFLVAGISCLLTIGSLTTLAVLRFQSSNLTAKITEVNRNIEILEGSNASLGQQNH
jgi:hypothetical protein